MHLRFAVIKQFNLVYLGCNRKMHFLSYRIVADGLETSKYYVVYFQLSIVSFNTICKTDPNCYRIKYITTTIVTTIIQTENLHHFN